MDENPLLEQRARLFLLENMYGNRKRYSFSNPEFQNEVKFLEFKRYAKRVNNSTTVHYVLTPEGIEFILAQQ